jgi:hypothetical protein
LFEQKIILEAFSFFGVKGGGVATALFDGALRPPPLTRKKTTLVQSHLSQMLVNLYKIFLTPSTPIPKADYGQANARPRIRFYAMGYKYVLDNSGASFKVRPLILKEAFLL